MSGRSFACAAAAIIAAVSVSCADGKATSDDIGADVANDVAGDVVDADVDVDEDVTADAAVTPIDVSGWGRTPSGTSCSRRPMLRAAKGRFL